MAKLLLLFQAQDGTSLDEVLAEQVQGEFAGVDGVTVQLMEALSEDPFYNARAHLPRPSAVLELVTRAGIPLTCVTEALARLTRDLPLAGGSLAFALHHRHFIAAPPQPVHYHQLMFPKAGWGVPTTWITTAGFTAAWDLIRRALQGTHRITLMPRRRRPLLPRWRSGRCLPGVFPN